MRRYAALVAFVIALSPIHGSVAAPPTPDTPTLNAEAAKLEAAISPTHLWYGQIFGAYFSSPDKLPDQQIGLGSVGDSGLWTGVYLAAESFRYAVAKQHIAAATSDEERAAWQAQKDEAKARIDLMVAMDHIRANIAKNWTPEPPDPSRAPQDGPEGGLFHGEAGILFRDCFPAGVPSWQQNQDPKTRHRQIFGPLDWNEPNPWNAKQFYCEDAASRDTHAGTFFGWLTAFDLVGPDDPTLRHEIRDDVFTVVNYLATHAWSVFHPYSRITTSGSENFIFPLFLINPQPRLGLAQAARHVADVDGSVTDQAKWDAYWNEELASMGPNLSTEYLLAIQSPHNSYYNFNLNHLTNFNVIREETDPNVRDYLKREFAIIDATTRDDVNAHFEAITYALTGEPDRLEKAVRHLTQWIDYRNGTSNITNSSRCGKDLRCILEGTTDWHQNGPNGDIEVDQPEASNTPSTKLRSATPLPVALRAPQQDFLWQRSPYQLDGAYNPQDEEPGVDFLTPYWMLRYYTEIAPPSLAPFPEWDGPTAGGGSDS